MRIDVNASLGAYPWRRVPGTSAESLLAAMDRTGIDQAWVHHLPSVFWRDPMGGNEWLLRTCASAPKLLPVPAIHPELPDWEGELDRMQAAGVRVVRADPTWYGIPPAGPAMTSLVMAVGARNMTLAMAVRFEDGRQRHPLDQAPELPASAVREIARTPGGARILVTHAERSFIEEVHFGLTPAEASRLWWDTAWIWGPPEDHLETLLETVGPSRFVLGTGQPLRLPETSIARLDLLDLDVALREQIEGQNARRVLGDAG